MLIILIPRQVDLLRIAVVVFLFDSGVDGAADERGEVHGDGWVFGNWRPHVEGEVLSGGCREVQCVVYFLPEVFSNNLAVGYGELKVACEEVVTASWDAGQCYLGVAE